MRYYSTQRPVSPGTYPSGCPVQGIHNFDRKTFCEEIGREAWGYIDFAGPLPEGEATRYELTAAGLKKFWCVTTRVYDSGRVVAAITREIEADSIPLDTFKSTSRYDIWNDWFDTREAAERRVDEAKKA